MWLLDMLALRQQGDAVAAALCPVLSSNQVYKVGACVWVRVGG